MLDSVVKDLANALLPPPLRLVALSSEPETHSDMLCRAILLTVALGFLASATPIQHDRLGISIPLSKRGSLTTSDGKFDGPKAVAARLKLERYVALAFTT